MSEESQAAADHGDETKPSPKRYLNPSDPILITGATTGIGRALAEMLAKRHIPLILHCRDAGRGRDVIETLKPLAGNATLELEVADLASQSQTRDMARRIAAKHPSLYGLVNNAGVIMGERIVSDEGVEISLAVNHVAGFLLTQELADNLAKGGGRVVNVNTFLHKRAALDWDDLGAEKFYRPITVYGNAKLLNLMTTYAWARRLLERKVTVNAYNPGVVRTKMLGGGMMRVFAPFIAKSPKTAASTIVYLLLSPKLDGASGGYYAATGSVKSSSAESGDENLQERAFAATQKLLTAAPASA